ncbi:MAG: recombinase family protein [Pseudomonadota bacterium]
MGAKEGDVVIVCWSGHLARSPFQHLLNILTELMDNKIDFRSLDGIWADTTLHG